MQIKVPARYIIVWQDLTATSISAQTEGRVGLTLLHQRAVRAVRAECGAALDPEEERALLHWLGSVRRVTGDSFAVLGDDGEPVARVVAL